MVTLATSPWAIFPSKSLRLSLVGPLEECRNWAATSIATTASSTYARVARDGRFTMPRGYRADQDPRPP